MGRIGMPEEIYQQRRAFFGTAAMGSRHSQAVVDIAAS